MRVIEKTVYTFSELSEDAKKEAYNEWLQHEDYSWHYENVDTLKAFCDIVNVDYKHIKYEYGYHNYINVNYDFDDSILELKGVRLATYLWNNYAKRLYKGKFYNKGQYVNGKYSSKSRHSKIIKSWDDCPLTGYCMDYDITKPMIDFIENPKESLNIEDVLNDCFNSWVYACNSDYESCHTMEYFADFAEGNDFEFYENGDRL